MSSRTFNNSGINVFDRGKTFKNFEPWNAAAAEMKSKATYYYLNFDKALDEDYKGILLCGNSGCGKTHLLLALANNFMDKKGKQVIYMPYRDAMTDLKQHMLDSHYYRERIKKYQDCDILLIDDLFKGKITETDINIMFEIINHRYLARLPIMISTEFTIDKLLNFDEAIGSRIVEMSADYTVEVFGRENNYRLRPKSKGGSNGTTIQTD